MRPGQPKSAGVFSIDRVDGPPRKAAPGVVASWKTTTMPARTTRQAARARILATVEAHLDRMIRVDEEVPLKGGTFADFEDQVEELARGALPVMDRSLTKTTRRNWSSSSASSSMARMSAPVTYFRPGLNC